MPCPHDVDLNHLDIYVAICKPMDNGWVHWMLILVHPNAKRCTYIHSTGRPGERDLTIEGEKRFDSWSIEKHKLERKGLIRPGKFEHFMYDYRHRMNEDYGPGDDYPLGIRM